jgi:hypothetical protein
VPITGFEIENTIVAFAGEQETKIKIILKIMVKKYLIPFPTI